MKAKAGRERDRVCKNLGEGRRQSEEWGTFSASDILHFILFFYTAPSFPRFPRRSLPLSPFHSFFLLSFVTCHPAQVSALHPLHLFSPLTPMLKRDNGTPCCVMMCTRARVKMSELIYSVLCSHRSMMPCSCLTKQPTDIEVRTQSFTQMCTRPHYVDTLKWDHDGVISSGDLAKKKFKQIFLNVVFPRSRLLLFIQSQDLS